MNETQLRHRLQEQGKQLAELARELAADIEAGRDIETGKGLEASKRARIRKEGAVEFPQRAARLAAEMPELETWQQADQLQRIASQIRPLAWAHVHIAKEDDR